MPTKQQKRISEIEACKEELKKNLVNVLIEFTDKFLIKKLINVDPIILDVLSEIINENEYTISGTLKFSNKQKDHICYQIGEWYLSMKPLLEGQHNLGHMKERLKMMICGDE